MAMEDLCRTYWFPLYAFARRCGNSKEDAEDLTQGFFARLLAGNDLERMSPERGRFRAFLLAAMKNFLANEWDKSVRQKRGGGLPALSMNNLDAEARYQVEPSHTLSPDKLYDRAWALTLLERVLCKLEHANAGNAAFARLKPCLTAESRAIDHAAVAAELGSSEGAVRVAVHRLRRQYRDFLRAEISDTLDDPDDFEDELKALYASFSR